MEGSLLAREHRLNEIGIALSKERNVMRMLEMILEGARELTQADGSTIYTVTDEQTLKFQIMKTHSLNLYFGGDRGNPVPFADLLLKKGDGTDDDRFTVTYAVNHKQSIHVQDAYAEKGFDFSKTKEFDKKTGYRTRAVLSVPIFNHDSDVIAVLQLINPMEGDGFTESDQQVAESLASQAGMVLNNQLLIQKLRDLFESLVSILAKAIDEMSPVTGHHEERVPEVTMMIAKAVNISGYAQLSDPELYELKIAALLHDCGKITTPQHILEKKDKLEGLFDQIALVDIQLDLRKKDLEIAHLKGEYDEATLHGKQQAIEEARLFLHRCNQGPVLGEAQEQLGQLHQQGLITDQQWEQLKVPTGNLTDVERKIMQYHVVMTINMLSQLKYPKDLQKVPAIAGAHHEWLNGKGYPNGLKGEELSLQMRMLTMADVFEALSAPDRPYKEKFKISKVLDIMRKMCEEGHLDPKLFEVFISQKVYLHYAKQFLTPEQIDMM